MSSTSFDSSFEAYREQEKSPHRLRLTERLCDVSHFLLRLRMQMRYGKLSRAPLHMLRMEMHPGSVEFECLARAGDAWDADISERLARRHVTLQVLHDAIDLRAILFQTIPAVDEALIRIYRDSDEGRRELIMIGHTHRNDHSARGVHSLSMRARILGFQFHVDNERLRVIPPDNPLPSLP